MSFADTLIRLPRVKSPLLERFERLISASETRHLEAMAVQSRQITLRHFGRTIRLFAPLYVSNECVNNCAYCGFSRDNHILRVTLNLPQVLAEARHLADQGFRHLLLVSGEQSRFVSVEYLRDLTRALRSLMPSISLEVGPMETDEYRRVVEAGAEGLVAYQETYHREMYAQVHTHGPKKDFDWRLETPERAAAAGFKRLGIGALFGLAPWREEALALAAHAEYLLRECWKCQITVSLPRLRPAAGSYEPRHPLGDRELVQLVCALRICFPTLGIVLSTREPAALRDGLIPLGVTMISAGSHTEPGGYTGAGRDQVHVTVGGRVRMDGERGTVETIKSEGQSLTPAEEQFAVADLRSPDEMARRLREMGYEPVWKDWDAVLAPGMAEALS
ncbi:MAG: 2-iminoacetate synthase ThiH [Verrucomicrobiae bacterium]|nr:2-iminoacetate synthase ThiH [Verrucomicrobiae bacterium]